MIFRAFGVAALVLGAAFIDAVPALAQALNDASVDPAAILLFGLASLLLHAESRRRATPAEGDLQA